MTKNYIKFKEDFFSIISNSGRIVISSHLFPDDDSFGSVLALKYILDKKFKDKEIVVLYEAINDNAREKINLYKNINFVSNLADALKQDDTLIILDVNNKKRVSKYSENFPELKYSVCIDHHKSIPDDFDLILIDGDRLATADLVFSIFKEECGEFLDKNLAEVLLMGILGDTGGLSYVGKNNLYLFELVKELLLFVDMPISDFYCLYRKIKPRIMPLLAEFMKNLKFEKINEHPGFCYSFVSVDFARLNNYSDEELSEARHIFIGQYINKIEESFWGFVLNPKEDGSVSVSLRSSLGGLNVRILAESMNIGGGHDRASGGSFETIDGQVSKPEDCINSILSWLNTNKSVTL